MRSEAHNRTAGQHAPPFWLIIDTSRGWYEALAIAAAAYRRWGFWCDDLSTSINTGIALPRDSVFVVSASSSVSL
jgi:hypothetical protein